jgi:hypothetical protein
LLKDERTLIIDDTHDKECQQDLPDASVGDNIDEVLDLLGQVDAGDLG